MVYVKGLSNRFCYTTSSPINIIHQPFHMIIATTPTASPSMTATLKPVEAAPPSLSLPLVALDSAADSVSELWLAPVELTSVLDTVVSDVVEVGVVVVVVVSSSDEDASLDDAVVVVSSSSDEDASLDDAVVVVSSSVDVETSLDSVVVVSSTLVVERVLEVVLVVLVVSPSSPALSTISWTQAAASSE